MREILEFMGPAVCQQLRRAVEIGRWPDGSRLSEEQRKLCLRAVLLYEAQTLPPEQRSGYVGKPSRATACDRETSDGSDEQELIARLKMTPVE